jgi:hypothetical protein
MGAAQSKRMMLPSSTIFKLLDECLIPDEKDTILDYFEMIELKLLDKDKSVVEQARNELKGLGGIPLVLKVIRLRYIYTNMY